MNPWLSESWATRARRILTVGVLSSCCVVGAPAMADDAEDEVAATSVPQVDNKVKRLRKRVRALEAEVAALQTRHLPVEASVDCGTGGSINEALTAHAQGEGLLTIRVSGTCNEAVRVTRSNVVIQGQGPATVVNSAAPALFTIMVDDNADHVTVRDLTVSGGTTAAVVANQGSHVTVMNAVATQSPSGVMALDNSVLYVTGSALRGNTQGAYAARGGVISISSSTVENNTVGVLAWKAGTVILTSSPPDLGAGVGPIVQNNVSGAVARSGGFLELADTTIQNNTGNGVVLDTGGTAHFFSRLREGGGNRVLGNANNGIVAQRNANLVFQDNTNTITANGRGILCINNPAYLAPVGFVVTGNTTGDILNCVP